MHTVLRIPDTYVLSNCKLHLYDDGNDNIGEKCLNGKGRGGKRVGFMETMEGFSKGELIKTY